MHSKGVTMAYDLSTDVELDLNYAGTPNPAYMYAFSAFSSNTTIVTASVTYTLATAGTFNAGAYSNFTVSTNSGEVTTFDLGYSSGPISGSTYYTSAPNTLTATTPGPASTTEGYGTLQLSSTQANSSTQSAINFKGIDNTLVVTGSLVSTPNLGALITNFQSAGDQIVLSGLAYASGTAITGYSVSGSTATLSFTDSGATYTLRLGGMNSTDAVGNFAIGKTAVAEGGNTSTYSGDVVISFVPCFLAGTMIGTPSGEVAVESLRAGDLVTVIEFGRPVTRPVTWVGGRSMRASDFHQRSDAFPIRIRQGAFAGNVPHRDLLVTAEHCILTEAGLTPARMLVNGASILIDRDIPDYDFFHVELEHHGILLSEGLATESYLDSGNRSLFEGATSIVAVRPEHVLAAPLAVARAVVEPIWNRLADRARSLGLDVADRSDAASLTDQPDLRLLLDDGRELPACWHDRQRHIFHIPRGARPLRLLSRSAVPAEVTGPFVDDRRTLGVAIDRLVLWNGLHERVVPQAGVALGGWHRSPGETDWTDGNAELDLPRADAETFIDIHLAGTMLYREELCLAA